MNRYKYSEIKNYGPNKLSLDQHPLTYCMIQGPDQMFIHGSNSYTINNNSLECQRYMSEYCANEWDGFCDVASLRKDKYNPADKFTAGEMLVANTAERKYLKDMINGRRVFQPFNPVDYSSPIINYWASGAPIYEVDPETIDTDPVMNRVLQNPYASRELLLNIYNTMKRKGSVDKLKNTNLGKFYEYIGLKL